MSVFDVLMNANAYQPKIIALLTKLKAPESQIGRTYIKFAVEDLANQHKKSSTIKLIELKNILSDIADYFRSTQNSVECSIRYYVRKWWNESKPLQKLFAKKPTTKRLVVKLYEMIICEV